MSQDDSASATGADVIPLTGTAIDRMDPAQRRKVLAVLRPFTPEARRMAPLERLDTLLSVPDVETFVPSLPTEELYFFLQDVGLDDCAELVRYASGEQVRGFVDLAAWRRDSFDTATFKRWFDLFAHNGPAEVRRLVRAVDPELVLLLILRTAVVHDAREAPEDVPDGRTLLPSPDGAFALEMDDQDDLLPLVKASLDALYANDVEEGRKFLQAARWELASELEESCYRWRSARLEDFGFLPFEEAMEAEQDIDIGALERALAKGAAAEEPGYEPGDVHPFTGWFLAEAHDAPYLARILGELPPGAGRDRLLLGFTHLVNRRLSLRGLDVGEWDTLQDESAHAFRMVSIGLERLARGTGLDGVTLLGRLPLLAMYRVGRTLLAGLQRRAAAAARRAGETRAQPWDPPLDWWLEALRLTPPRRYAAPLVGGTAPAQAPTQAKAREFFVPFRSLAEVDEADRVLVEAEAVLHFFENRHGWGTGRFDEPDLAALGEERRGDVRFSTLLMTGMANRILDRSADLRPLAADDVRDLVQMLFVSGPTGRTLDPRLKREAQEQLIAVSGRMPDAEREALFGFVSACLTRFEETLAGLPPDETPDPRFLGDIVLVV